MSTGATTTTSTATPDADTATTAATGPPSPARSGLPLVVHVLALGTFLMMTTEFVVAGILPEVADGLGVSMARAGSLITTFAVGMVVGAPLMTVLSMRLSKRATLVVAMAVFVVGHVVVALGESFALVIVARLVTAFATGAFWAVSAVVATRAAGPGAGARALGVVSAGAALATVAGVPIGALVAQLLGWRGTFWFLAVAGAAVAVLIARKVQADTDDGAALPLRASLAGLRSGRFWLALLACVTTTGGVLAAFSFIAPTLTDHGGVPASFVPLVLTGFGLGSFVGTLLGGRFGDARPGLVTILTPAVSTVLMVGIAVVSGAPWLMTALVVLLGLFGLSANGVLIHLAVGHAGEAAPFGSALTVSAFNVGSAIGTAAAGATLATPLGTHGPAAVGAAVVALTLAPTIALALLRRRP